METLFKLFGHVCGQQVEHTWLPAGVLLPVCQRCTGLYVGAALAAALLLWVRPRLEGWFLQVHGGFLLGMAPFGLHWVEHGPEVRTITGLLFGAAAVVFLSLWPIEMLGSLARAPRREQSPAPCGTEQRTTAGLRLRHRGGARRYLIALSAGAVSLPFLCQAASVPAAVVLAAAIAGGGLTFVLLVVLNALALAWSLARLGRRPTASVPA